MKKFVSLFCAASALALATAEAAVIEGRVTDATGDVGLQGASVRVAQTGQTVRAGRDGGYRIAGLDAGQYTLVASYVGAAPVEIIVDVASADAEIERSIALGEDARIVDNVLVVGQRGALNSALSQQRSSDKVISVLSADAIGQLPDENVAEAARRAPGVNVLNDQGEGRFVSIRGANPNFVTTTINGVRIPSPEADARQVPLDVIDSDILSSITVTKSLTPDVDGDSIGGNVEISTLSGLNRKDMFLKLKAAGIYTDQTDQFGQRYSGVYANNFLDGKLGIAGSVAWQERKFGSENKEVDGPDWELGEAIPYPEELEFRDYQITRERLSTSLNLDFQANDEIMFYVHGLYSDFSDQEFRSRVENKFGDPDFDSANGSIAIFDAAADDPYEVDRDIKDRLEEQTIYSVVSGAEYQKGAMTLDFSAAYSFADEVEPDRLDTDFRAEFEEGLFGVDVADTILPSLAFPDAAAEAAYFDASNYEFDGLELTNGVAEDEEYAFTGNMKYDVDMFGAPGYVKLGGKIRLREKSYDLDLAVFDGFDGDDLLLTQFQNDVDFDLDRINPVVGAGSVRDFFFANEGAFELNAIDTALESTAANYVANEDVYAGYAMAQRQFGAVSVVAGLRVEHTEYRADGFNVLLQEFEGVFDGDRSADGASLIPAPTVAGVLVAENVDVEFEDGETTVEAERVFSEAVSVDNGYTDFLPSANFRWDVNEDVVARFGYYKTIVRPNLEAAAPRVLVEQGEEGENADIERAVEGEAGNPDLERQQAHNIDVALEWYPNNDSLISVGFFYKNIKDFIAPIQREEVTINGVFFDEVSTFTNLDDASIYGVEFNVQKPLDFLPGLLDGLIVSANYTFVNSETTLDDGREISLPGQSDHVATGILGYEKGPLNLRVAATYRSDYVDEILGDLDRIVDDHFQVDVSAKYNITDQFRVFAEFKNLNNEPFVAVIRPNGFGDLNSQFEEYGWSTKFGVAFTY